MSAGYIITSYTTDIERIEIISDKIYYENAIKNGARPMFIPDSMPHNPQVFVVGYLRSEE